MDAGTILLVALVSAGLGYLAGIILTRKSKNDQTLMDIDKAEKGPRYDANHLDVCLWSKTPKGPLSADIYGRTFHKREDVSEQEKNRLIMDIRTIEAWFGLGSLKPSDAVPQKPAFESQPITIENNITAPQPATVEMILPEVHLPEPVIPATTPVQVFNPTVNPINVNTEVRPLPPITGVLTEAQLDQIMPPPPVAPVQARLDLRAKVKEPEPKSIVQQIDDILQEKVAVSSLAGTGLKLQETPQGVLVWVGNKSFQGIDNVPEGEAKILIRSAVKDWEKR